MRAGFSRHFASVRIVLPDRMVVHYPAMIPRVHGDRIHMAPLVSS